MLLQKLDVLEYGCPEGRGTIFSADLRASPGPRRPPFRTHMRCVTATPESFDNG